MSRPSLRIYLVRSANGLYTGRAIPRGHTAWRFIATGTSEENVLAELDHAIARALDEDPEAIEAFSWTEDLHAATVLVEVRQETTVEKRTVIGKERIPLRITYAWCEIAGDKQRAPA